MGRPSKLVGDVQERIVGYVRLGLSNEVACQAVGVSRGSLYRWLARGADDAACENIEECDLKGKHDTGDCPLNVQYRDFRDALTKGRGEFQAIFASIVVSAARGTQRKNADGTPKVDAEGLPEWKAPPDARYALELLQRRAPREWKGVVPSDSEQRGGIPFTFTLIEENRPESEMAALLAAPSAGPAPAPAEADDA